MHKTFLVRITTPPTVQLPSADDVRRAVLKGVTVERATVNESPPELTPLDITALYQAAEFFLGQWPDDHIAGDLRTAKEKLRKGVMFEEWRR
jgi:hypothetical protein